MHGWIRIASQPEPGLAIFDAGRRDLPFDQDMPEPQLIRPRSDGEPVLAATGMTVTKLNDQHGYLRFGDATGRDRRRAHGSACRIRVRRSTSGG